MSRHGEAKCSKSQIRKTTKEFVSPLLVVYSAVHGLFQGKGGGLQERKTVEERKGKPFLLIRG